MTIEAIRETLEDWRRSELDGDAGRLSELFHEKFVGVRPRGFVLDKSGWLGRYQSGDLKNARFELTDLSIRTFDNVAIAVATHNQISASRGRDASGCFRTTVVLQENGQVWSIVHLQLSPMAA